jgi:magnesium transporter
MSLMIASSSALGVSASVVASAVYGRDGQKHVVEVTQISAVLKAENSLLWVGLHDPAPDVIDMIVAQLGLDAAVGQDMGATHRVPKVMDYGTAVLVVAMTVEVRSTDGLPAFGETQLLIGSNYLITLRRGAIASHTALRQRMESRPDQLALGSAFVASELLDLLIDRYNLAHDMFERAVEPMEQAMILRGLEKLKVRRLYQLRRDFQRMHNAIAPLGEVCRRLSHREFLPINAQARPLFADLADRVYRVDRLLDNLGDGLTFAFEAGMLIEQAKQTETTRRLAAWAAILAVPTAIAGIYGMNFEYMPELQWKYGYLVILGLMGTICGTLFYKFRQAKWL